MRLSKAFFASLREVPRDADTVSQQLMMRSNMIRKHAAGIYSYLPLLMRSYNKFVEIMREEFTRIDWQEIVMPMVVPSELWKESGRWGAYGKELLRLKDRKGNEFCLGPTHEEVVTDIVRGQVSSYKQLPITLYQITGKFRDEIRPRFGLMRGREFVMMDGYSFHAEREGLDRHYEEISEAYSNIFKRAGLRFVRVEADTGAIGGSGSHEFHVLASTGEDAIFSCASCGYGANVEKAETPLPSKQKKDWGVASAQPMQDLATPEQRTIAQVSELSKIPHHRNIKTLVFRYMLVEKPGEWLPVVAFVAGDRELNDVKLKVALAQTGKIILDFGPMPEPDVEKLFNCPTGFLGPIGVAAHVPLFFDREVLAMHDAVMGANRAGFHLQHVEASRDLKISVEQIKDLVKAIKGEPCPRCADGVYQEDRGIEVGHIFKLGTKYSKAMNATVQNKDKQSVVMEMGCYGIGATRVIAACIEQNHDADGIVWPESLAPYAVLLVNLAPEDANSAQVADGFYTELKKRGVEVLYDDRADLSPGVKFKDADLLGIPRRLVVGKKGLEKGEVEFSLRKDKKKEFLPYKSVADLLPICERLSFKA